MGDPFMYARGAMLIEFGCPPLPIANARRKETGEPATANSHDLLSAFMIQAFKQQDEKFNAARKKNQEAAQAAYRADLAASDGSLQSVYAAMAKYTQAYLGSFLRPPLMPQDVQVLPPDHISPALMGAIRSYHRAMYIAKGEKAPSPEEPASLATALRGCQQLLCA